jgi:quercetin dioxygenase-like cupin family protein
MADRSKVVRQQGFRWSGIVKKEYKTAGSHFQDIGRHTLLGDGADESALSSALRYFEIQPGGYSSLERHQHPHMVVVVRGRGSVILGDRVEPVDHLDCVYVAPGTFHQFHANAGEPLGFLCVVDRERDRPVLPTAEEQEQLAANPTVAKLMKV